jgi:2-keto-4-pentenoate hydratase/2-oxohepta-3-ene-1,7-dioic acid hydratase in catechol pathway
MRIANVDGRAKLVVGATAIDVAEATGGRFGPGLPQLYEVWDDFVDHVTQDVKVPPSAPGGPFDPTLAGPPSPAPRQVFAVALNYRDHAAESGVRPPDDPLVFAKYVSAFSGPVSEVALPDGGHVDWECELVAVVGRTAHRIGASEGWSYVAGLTVGQDLSERLLQRSGPVPQFGLGKSYPGFAPTGPLLVTADELDDPDDLAIGCDLNGRPVQSARTSDLIFPVPELVAYLSRVVVLYPGDVIFTGTPPGVGMGRSPQVYLQPGDHLRSHIEGIGELHQVFVRGS